MLLLATVPWKNPRLATDHVDGPAQSSSRVPYETPERASPPQKKVMSPAASPLTSPEAHSPTLIMVAEPPTMPLCAMVVPAQSMHRMPTAVAPDGKESVGAPYAITFVREGDAPSMKIAIPVPPPLGSVRYVPL